MSVSPLDLARAAAEAADEKKAEDICLLDLTGVSDIANYFLICSASNNRLRDVVCEAIEDKLRIDYGEKPLQVEGRASGGWMVMDYGQLIVHVFLPETRAFYRLERLWGDVPFVQLGLEGELTGELPGDADEVEVVRGLNPEDFLADDEL